MTRHELDPFALVFGIVFFGLGLGSLLGVRVDRLWPVLLIAAGIAGLVGTRPRARRTDTE